MKVERKENEELKIKLVVLNVEIEQLKLILFRDNEVKDFRNILEINIQKVIQLQEKVEKLISEKFDFLREIREFKQEKEKLEEFLNNNKRELEKVEKNVKDFIGFKEENFRLKDEKESLKFKLVDLESEKQVSEGKLKRECEVVNVKLQSVEQELEEQKILLVKRWNKIEDVEDLRQENKLL